jgi:uncharacterized protein YuzE
MKYIYTKLTDVLYIRLKNAKITRTIPGGDLSTKDLTILDLDKDGDIVGIELLFASKRVPKKLLHSNRIRQEHPLVLVV